MVWSRKTGAWKRWTAKHRFLPNPPRCEPLACEGLGKISTSLIQGSFHASGSERDLAEASPGGIEDGVAYRRSDNRNGRLTRARGFDVSPIEQHAVDERHRYSQRQAVIRAPTGRGDFPIVPGDFFPESTTHSLQHATFDLIL